MLPGEIIDQVAQEIKNQLQAHDSDLEEELKTNEDSQASITFTLSIKRIAGDKHCAKIKTRVPRAAVVVETLLSDWQLRLPGM